MRTQVVLAGPHLPALLELSLLLDKASYSVYAIESKSPVERLLEGGVEAEAAVVHLNGRENVGDLQRLFDCFPETRFILLADEFPPRAALARLVHRNASAILRAQEQPVFVVATLVAMLAAAFGASA